MVDSLEEELVLHDQAVVDMVEGVVVAGNYLAVVVVEVVTSSWLVAAASFVEVDVDTEDSFRNDQVEG